jgi:hypothetical protein
MTSSFLKTDSWLNSSSPRPIANRIRSRDFRLRELFQSRPFDPSVTERSNTLATSSDEKQYLSNRPLALVNVEW